MIEPRFDRVSVQKLYKQKCQLMDEIKILHNLCKEAAHFYDLLSLGSLEHAAMYGPDARQPNDEDCLAMRQKLEDAQRLEKCLNCGRKLTPDDSPDTCMECIVYLEQLQEYQSKEQHRVTKDMATDAGDPDLEGELI